MAIEYQFNNRFNWLLFHDQTYNATDVNPVLERFKPILPIKLPNTIDSPIMAIFCANSEAQGNWRYGARYLAKMTTTFVINGKQTDTVLKVGKLYLDQVEIVQLQPVSSSYALEIQVPYWHRQFQLKIWEYTGNNQNTVHRKLDDLLGNPMT